MDDRRLSIQQWFRQPVPAIPFRPVVGGLVFVVLGLLVGGRDAGPMLAFAGLVALAIGLWRYRRDRTSYLTRPHLQQMLHWLDEDLRGVADSSIARVSLGLSDLVRESVFIAGPLYAGAAGLSFEQTHCRRGITDDPNAPYLYGCWAITIFHFTRGTMVLCRCSYDWCAGLVVGERTDEVGYEHLVSFSTGPSRRTYNTYDGPQDGVTEFAVSLANGDRVEVVIGAGSLRPANWDRLNQLASSAVQAISSAKRDWSGATARPVTTFAATAVTASTVGQRVVTTPISKFCTTCGREYQPGEGYCPLCGAPRQVFRT